MGKCAARLPKILVLTCEPDLARQLVVGVDEVRRQRVKARGAWEPSERHVAKPSVGELRRVLYGAAVAFAVVDVDLWGVAVVVMDPGWLGPADQFGVLVSDRLASRSGRTRRDPKGGEAGHVLAEIKNPNTGGGLPPGLRIW